MRTDNPKLNPAKAIEAARQLKESIRAMLASEAEELTADDQEVARDTFDGATTLDAEIREAALMVQRNKAFSAGCAVEIANLQKRKQRFPLHERESAPRAVEPREFSKNPIH